ncbi:MULTISPECIES: DNA adenine methylase [Halomicrobium]|uniref:D12 class N6 adenine-specific DNA methyltransferase n=2 Tax=Halomicrobium mukohataei TaxID=57705 RepID=C7NYD8_HALMD|nr:MULTISPECIES: DNA adenine methylase [Halomicrobium]ACV46599.1 D12 class N6 adenine-specific DNA methyltransferase [Halomicrobium mukohataei DSM 12286]QCD65138.1 DNA adenine methylase [Halomicrobium mukohataei]QFR19944.1 DNA adenine methylase [Halomicrobium sp. ZPS1]
MSLSAFPYPGGKTYHVDEILGYFPDHELYVEPFGGSASILLNKAPSHIEVLNDLDRDVVHFYQVLRQQREELQKWLRTVPFSRELHGRWARKFYDGHRPDDDIVRAGRWFYLRYTQYSGKLDGISGFKASTIRNEARRLQNATDALDQVADRLQHVTLECLDYNRLCEKYDRSEALLYFDPPYVGPGDDLYTHDGEFDHDKLVATLTELEGKWICSYGDLPDELESAIKEFGWSKRQYQIHYSINGDQREPATERLVMNFDPDEAIPFRSTQQTGLESFGGEWR